MQVRIRTRTLSGNDLIQVVHTHVPLSSSSRIWYRLHRWDVSRHTADTLAPYPWSRSVKTGFWLRANETEISATLWALRIGRTLRLLYGVFTRSSKRPANFQQP